MHLSRCTFLLALAAAGRDAGASPAVHLPRHSSVPGGIALVPLGGARQRPVARQVQVPLLVVGEPTEWTALVGIPLAAPPGRSEIQVHRDGEPPRTFEFEVRPKKHLDQRLRVAPAQVDLSPADQARYEWRVVEPGAGGTVLKLDPSVLTGVIVGARASASTMQFVRRLNKRRNTQLNVSKAFLSPTTYQLEVRAVAPT